MSSLKWKMERREHCFVVGREDRKPNIKIEYGDTENNIPLYGDFYEARAIAVIIEHALNGITLNHPRPFSSALAERVRRDFPEFVEAMERDLASNEPQPSSTLSSPQGN